MMPLTLKTAFMTNRKPINNGEKAQYYVTEHHEAIISAEDFETAQAMIKRRSNEMKIKTGEGKYQNRYPFSGKIICGECGATWKRRTHSESKVKYFAYLFCTVYCSQSKANNMLLKCWACFLAAALSTEIIIYHMFK